MTPSTNAITPESWRAFFILVGKLRAAQLIHAKTFNATVRRQADELAEQVDAAWNRLNAAMHSAAVAVEGGAP
jgi:hypothetical protein